jgi:hypothetical protein
MFGMPAFPAQPIRISSKGWLRVDTRGLCAAVRVAGLVRLLDDSLSLQRHSTVAR